MAWTNEFPKLFCSVEGCNLPIECKGVCNAHYQRFKKYGRYETAVWGQTEHPLYFTWNSRKNEGSLCNEWRDFKEFLKGVGERPVGDFRMGRLNKKEVFSPTNFYWKEYVKKIEGETRNQHNSRRRQENLELYKHNELMNTYGIPYAEFVSRLEAQNFVCKICKEPEKVRHHITGRIKALAVDHCHTTNKIRGLLCQRCNRVLGKVKDSIQLLDLMKVYLNGDG